MLRNRLFFLTLLSSLALAACQQPSGEVSLRVRPVLTGPQRTILTPVSPYTAADIDHLDVRLSRIVGGTPTLVAEAHVAGDALASTLKFDHLRANSAYVVAASAYADAAETQLISDGATSQVELLVGQDELATPVTVPVKLKTQVVLIEGTDAAAAITVAPGAWITPTPVPTPTPTATPTPAPTPTPYLDPCLFDPLNPACMP